MNIQTIRDEIAKQPFQAFTLRLADGTQVLVPHPDFFAVAPPRTIFVGKIGGGYEIIDPRHIVAVDRPNPPPTGKRPRSQGKA